jgi:hypothetical protein
MKILSMLLAMALAGFATIPANASSTAKSSDGRLTASIVPIGPGDDEGTGADALVLYERGAQKTRRLLVSKYDGDFRRNLTALSTPLFSLDGGFIYVSSSDASPSSGAVHQIDLRTGANRFVVAGQALKVMRTGPYRGYLLVQTHKYYDRPEGGSYNPVFVVRPDGHHEFMVPGSANDDGELAVEPWLAAKGWRAW